MTKRNHKNKQVRTRNASKGVRGERLPRDGVTFTNLTPIPRSVTSIPEQFSCYQEYSLLNWMTSSVTVPVFAAHYTNLNSINNATSFAAIFDQYMIDAMECWLIPNQTAAASASINGLLYSVIDLDDASALSTVAQFGEYSSCVTTMADQGHYRHFKPHVAIAAYNGAFTGYANRANQWIDAASLTVQHFGVKFGVSVTGSVLTYDLVVRIHCRFRQTH